MLKKIQKSLSNINHKRPSSILERISYLEGQRTSWQIVVTGFFALIGLLGAVFVYQTFITSIDNNVDTRVSTSVAKSVGESATKIASSVSTAEYAANQAVIAVSVLETLIPAPTPSLPSPESSLRTYFVLLNNEQYADAWIILTEDFQNRFSEGSFSNYVEFWKTVDHADVKDLAVKEQTETTASILIIIEWSNEEGTWENSYEYNLIFYVELDSWKINQVLNY